MRWIVNGTEFEGAGAKPVIRREGDRIWIQCVDGWKSAVLLQAGSKTLASFRGRQYTLEPYRSRSKRDSAPVSGEIRAPIPGLIVSVAVDAGQSVRKGQTLLVLEAMKTQISLTAPFDGVVDRLAINLGEQAKSNQILAIVK